jgi:hypothetical protein
MSMYLRGELEVELTPQGTRLRTRVCATVRVRVRARVRARVHVHTLTTSSPFPQAPSPSAFAPAAPAFPPFSLPLAQAPSSSRGASPSNTTPTAASQSTPSRARRACSAAASACALRCASGCVLYASRDVVAGTSWKRPLRATLRSSRRGRATQQATLCSRGRQGTSTPWWQLRARCVRHVTCVRASVRACEHVAISIDVTQSSILFCIHIHSCVTGDGCGSGAHCSCRQAKRLV